jgi:tyrosine-protein kinase Etk/Wzc
LKIEGRNVTPGSPETGFPQHAGSGERVSLIDLLLALVHRKRVLFGLPLLAGVTALVVVLVMPKWYTATAKIMPPQQSQSNAVAILGQLGVLAGGAAGQLGLKNPSDVYVTILKSRTVADNLVTRFNLKQVYDEDYAVEARKELARNSSLAAGREGVITIEVEDKDPKRAADIANAYVEELRALTVNLAVSEAAQRRLFFEGQLKKAKNDLTLAELELKKFNQETGLVSPQGQIGLSVAAAAALRAQIAAKEIQMSAMRTFATSNNPDLKRTMEELGSLRVELAKMEKDANAGKGDVMVPFGKAAEVGLEYLRKYRDMKYHETLYEVLAKQYEIARIDEAKDATLIQVLDVAVPPERRSKPQRTLIIITSVFVAAVLALLWALIAEVVTRARKDPEVEEKLRVLQKSATTF